VSDLDDALNTTAPVFAPTTVTADWAELPSDISVGGVDSLRDFGQQMGPNGMEVEHSVDDGMPDAVTMTGTNDASGKFHMGLIGRPANTADVIGGWKANTSSGNGSGTTIPVSLPAGLVANDYVLVAITVNNQSGVYENVYGVGHPFGWTLLGEVSDGVGPTLTTYVFGRQHSPVLTAPDFRIVTSGSFTWASGALGVNTTALAASVVPNVPGTTGALAEAGTGTSHSGPTTTLTGRGHALGVFATPNASGPWTVSSGGTQLVQNTGGVAALQLVKSAFIPDADPITFVSSSSGSTGVAMMLNVPLMVADRPAMDAMAYFSAYDSRSPIESFERDIAPVTAQVNVISPNGPVATTVFAGQMAEITVRGREADMEAVSKTRLLLDKALALPTVFGAREACTTDWLASYLMAQGGQYPGIAPSPNTRLWAPMHGSTHPHMSGANVYPGGIFYDTARTPAGPWGLKPPNVIDGPFVKAIHAQITNARVDYIFLSCATNKWDEEVPGQITKKYDLCTQSNSVGRITFWLRGDANVATPAALVGSGLADYLFAATIITQYDISGGFNYIRFEINAARQPVVWLENGVTLTGGDLPTDGLWHFYGFAWDYANGMVKTRRDNVTWTTGPYTSVGHAMATSEQAIYDGGRRVEFTLSSRLPIAELQVEAGPTLYTDLFTRFYPTPALPSQNALYRPTEQPLQAIAESTPVSGWATLQEVAEATLSTLRVNETDNIELVPQEYYAETAQMTVLAYNVLNTSVNAGDLDISSDPTKIRNLVTVSYQDTRVDSTRISLVDITGPISIPGGKTQLTFPLDLPAAEVHGAIDPNGVTWNITLLTALQVTGVNPLPNEHFMSVNKYEDGSAVTYVGAGVKARIVNWESFTVTLEFTNTTGATYYLANNGSGIPFLRILGYPVRKVDAFSAFFDPTSAAKRRERSLVVDNNRWIQDAITANEIAGSIVTATSGPRPFMNVTVMGDPRRKPGQLVSISDSEGTRADGTWRIIYVRHAQGGAMYLQDLTLVRVGPIGYWDIGLWDDAVWGE
jgi:hypothetical protein